MEILASLVRRAYLSVVVVAAILCAAILIAATHWTAVVLSYEDASFALKPSAEKAFSYGSRHFNSSRGDYDIDRAEHFYLEAVALDTDTPYVFHELARIAFLRGNLPGALVLINIQIQKFGDDAPNSYYVRGLIEGYMGLYDEAIADYQQYLSYDPNNWAAINDYAWVLLRAGRAADVVVATSRALDMYPENPWLLNTHTIALYETGDITAAYVVASRAVEAADTITEAEWLKAYPGNDPGIAADGIQSLQDATRSNMHRISIEVGVDALE